MRGGERGRVDRKQNWKPFIVRQKSKSTKPHRREEGEKLSMQIIIGGRKEKLEF